MAKEADVVGALESLHLGGSSDPLVINVQCPELTKLDKRDGLGRVVIAMQSAELGSKIIRERPVLVWNSSDWVDFLSGYQALSTEHQDGILDMFHPPLLESVPMQKLMIAAEAVARRASVSSSLAHKLMAICNTNAHEYYGHSQQAFEEISTFTGFSNRISSGRSALFLYASKVPHSCNPNTTYSSRTDDGCLEYKVIRPISSGEIVTFSYLDEIWETPTHIRREKLLDSKSFLCECERCMGPDYARLIRCVRCQQGVVLCISNGKGEVEWSCSSCGRVRCTDGLTRKEADIKRLLDKVERVILVNLAACLPKEMMREVTRSMTELHPLHFLTLRAMKMYVRLCASHAVQLDQIMADGIGGSMAGAVPPHVICVMMQRYGHPSKLRSEAARMGLKVVLAYECIASQCTESSCSNRNNPGAFDHPPVQDGCTTVFHACQDLIRCPSSSWPSFARAMVKRYLPVMRLQFGESDSDVAEIERKILSSAASFAFSSIDGGSSTTGSPIQQKKLSGEEGPGHKTKISGNKKKQRTNKKKKGRKR